MATQLSSDKDPINAIQQRATQIRKHAVKLYPQQDASHSGNRAAKHRLKDRYRWEEGLINARHQCVINRTWQPVPINHKLMKESHDFPADGLSRNREKPP
ncbi:hypothetical protein AAGW04_07900 [Pectobacterium aroidearum]|uniref:hypothetical protein n=1 Tax=Pectobacterium aroidearum TaxID=1201031 RepID=UPI003158DDA0